MRHAKTARRVFVLLVVVACAWAITNALKGQTLASVLESFHAIPLINLAVAIALVAINFAVMTAMEVLALRDAGARLPLRRAALSAFIGNALSVAAGFGPISGAGVRVGLFRTWQLPSHAALVTALSVTLMSLAGGAILASFGLALQPYVVASALGAPEALVRGFGISVLVLATVLLVAAGRRRAVFSMLGLPMSAPSAGGAIARLSLGALDWWISANVLAMLLSDVPRWTHLSFVAAFASAHFAGMAAGAPAGLGVFDALMLHLGATSNTSAQFAAALLLYRLIGQAAPALLAIGPYLFLSQCSAKLA